MKLPLTVTCILAAALLAGCKSAQSPAAAEIVAAPVNSTAIKPAPLPRAVVYKISGPATAANVPVQVNAAGEIVSFPAPADVKGREPIALVNGWFLDRRGISANSRFTRWTYSEYAALKQAPTPAEIKAAIIEGASVVDIHTLPMSPDEAAANPAAVNALIEKF